MLELNRVERQTERDVQHCGNRNLQKVRNYSGKRCGKAVEKRICEQITAECDER